MPIGLSICSTSYRFPPQSRWQFSGEKSSGSCTWRGAQGCHRGRPAPDIPPMPVQRRRWCWPQCPCFRSFCIRCVDILPDIPLRYPPHCCGRHRRHPPGRAHHWGRSGSRRNPETAAETPQEYYTTVSTRKSSKVGSFQNFFLPFRLSGLPAPFLRAGSGPFCQSTAA